MVELQRIYGSASSGLVGFGETEVLLGGHLVAGDGAQFGIFEGLVVLHRLNLNRKDNNLNL